MRDSVVIFDKDVYIKHMESLLSDKNKFEKVGTKKVLLNFTLTNQGIFKIFKIIRSFNCYAT